MVFRDQISKLSFLVFAVVSGCAGYAGNVAEVRSSLIAGDQKRALKMSNESMEVEESDQYPMDIRGKNALLVLERGTIKQGLGDYHSSSLDFRVADKHLELLDLRKDTVGSIGKWLFSGDSTVYKAPPHEKLLLHTLNMLNYLATGDLENARVEARRLSIMQNFLRDSGAKQDAYLGIGNYLAGFTFEMSKRPEQALQYYNDALGVHNYPSLLEPLRHLARYDNSPGTNIEKLLAEAVEPEPELETESEPKTEPEPQNSDMATILVVSSMGLAPHKEAVRLPIGAALVIASHSGNGPVLGADNSSKASALAAKGMLKWVMFSKMVKTKLRYSRVKVQIDGSQADIEDGEDIDALTIKAWDNVKGSLVAAAIVRMIARAIAGEVTNSAADAAGASGIAALLAGLLVEGAMTAADTPDTRSWVTLPSRIEITRKDVSPGEHTISVEFEGPAGKKIYKTVVNLKPGGFVVLPVTTMR